jgi:hypothetical protein
MSDQVPLFTESNGNGRRPTKHDPGLRETRPGPERLLGELSGWACPIRLYPLLPSSACSWTPRGPTNERPLDFAEAQRIVREAMRDKSYQLYPLGMEAAAYLRSKRKRLTKGLVPQVRVLPG